MHSPQSSPRTERRAPQQDSSRVRVRRPQDVLKKRRTEVDHLNGFISRKGREAGVPTPFCDKICEIVHSLGVGFEPSPEHIRPLISMLPY